MTFSQKISAFLIILGLVASPLHADESEHADPADKSKFKLDPIKSCAMIGLAALYGGAFGTYANYVLFEQPAYQPKPIVRHALKENWLRDGLEWLNSAPSTATDWPQKTDEYFSSTHVQYHYQARWFDGLKDELLVRFDESKHAQITDDLATLKVEVSKPSVGWIRKSKHIAEKFGFKEKYSSDRLLRLAILKVILNGMVTGRSYSGFNKPNTYVSGSIPRFIKYFLDTKPDSPDSDIDVVTFIDEQLQLQHASDLKEVSTKIELVDQRALSLIQHSTFDSYVRPDKPTESSPPGFAGTTKRN